MTENAIMTSSKTDKIKGAANEIAGKAKQGLGSAMGDESLRARGAAQELKGAAQKAGGAAKETVKKAVDKA